MIWLELYACLFLGLVCLALSWLVFSGVLPLAAPVRAGRRHRLRSLRRRLVRSLSARAARLRSRPKPLPKRQLPEGVVSLAAYRSRRRLEEERQEAARW